MEGSEIVAENLKKKWHYTPEYGKRYRERNRDRIRASSKKYHIKNRKEILKRRRLRYDPKKAKEYAQKNKARIKLCLENIYQRDKEKRKIASKLFYANNKEKIKITCQKYRQKNKEAIAKYYDVWRQNKFKTSYGVVWQEAMLLRDLKKEIKNQRKGQRL